MAETKISKAQAGSGIWTSDSLVAGTNISITQVPQPVIDENTLGVWHFDNNLNNAVSGSSYTVSSSTIVASNSQYKFGNYSLCSSSGSTGNITLIDQALPSGDFTVDYWLRTGNSSPSLTIGLNTSSDLNYGPTRQGLYINQNSTFIGFNTTSSGGTQGGTSYGTTIETASWHHIAMVRESNTVKYYLDGVLQSSKAASSTYYLQANFNYQAQGINYVPQFIDELRLSNIARWTSDFTPFTQPYSASAGPTQYQINDTKADPDLSSYLKNTATGTDGLTISGTAETNTRGTNIGVGSSISGNSSTAIGANSYASGANAVVIGSGTSSERPTAYNSCVAIGSVAKASVTGSIAIGSGSYCNNNGTYSVTVGTQSRATGSSSTTLGSYARSTGTGSIAIGSATGSSSDVYTNSSAEYSIAIGYNSKATATNAIQLGTGTNSTASTFKVFNTTIVDANGKVPTDSLEADLTTKADTDLSNVSATGKETAIGWGIPDYSAGVSIADQITDTNEHTYTAPKDGIIVCYLVGFNTNHAYLYIDNQKMADGTTSVNSSWNSITGQFAVSKNEVIRYKNGYPNAGIVGDRFIKFYPFKGVA